MIKWWGQQRELTRAEMQTDVRVHRVDLGKKRKHFPRDLYCLPQLRRKISSSSSLPSGSEILFKGMDFREG